MLEPEPSPRHAGADALPEDGWQPEEDRLVTDPAAVDILWHPNKRLHLRPFLAQEADLATASREVGIKKTLMSYWIERLQVAGLLRVARIEKRGRHRVRYHRAVARRFRVSLRDAPLATYEDLFDDFSRRWSGSLRTALGRALERQAPALELSVSMSAAGGVVTTILPREGVQQPPDDFIYSWARLWLDEDEKAALARDMNALYDKYAALSDEAAKPAAVLVHLVQVHERR